MFTVKVDCLQDFEDYVGFWGGAKVRYEALTEAQIDFLNEIISNFTFESLTQVNDFMWFESDELLELYFEEERSDEDEQSI